MSKQLTTKPIKEMQVYTSSNLIGVASQLSSSDIAVPSLILLQNNSTLVMEDDNLKAGDFLHSIDKEVWGARDKKPVELVFFYLFKTQIVSDVTETKKWLATNPWDARMQNEEYESVVEGRKIRRELCYNYVCFQADTAIELIHHVTGEVMYSASPIVVKFKGGSMRNGKRLNNAFDTYAKLGAPSWTTSFYLSANLDENDRGNKYWAYDFKKGKQATEVQQKAAESLCRQFMESKVQVKVVDEETSPDITIEADPRNVTPAPEPMGKIKNYAPQSAGDIV